MAVRAVLRVLCILSIIPLHSGLYAVVWCNLKPKEVEMLCNNLEVKFAPLSVTNVSGIPYLLIHEIKPAAQLSADVEVMGIASTHLVALSMIVKR